MSLLLVEEVEDVSQSHDIFSPIKRRMIVDKEILERDFLNL